MSHKTDLQYNSQNIHKSYTSKLLHYSNYSFSINLESSSLTYT